MIKIVGVNMTDMSTSFYMFFKDFLELTSERFSKKRFIGLAFGDVKKMVFKTLKRNGFKVSRRVLEFKSMDRGKRIVVYLHDARHGNFRFHVMSSLADYDGRFRIRPIAYSVTVVYVERIGEGILRRIASSLRRNFYASDTLAVKLTSLNPSYVSECDTKYKNICYICELLRADYSKYERSSWYTTFYQDIYRYEAGTKLEARESISITIDDVKEVFNVLAEQLSGGKEK